MLKKHDTGYHDLFSIMATVGIFDLLKLYDCELTTGKDSTVVTIVSDGGSFPNLIESINPEENLITRAARSYFGTINASANVRIGIEKNIPAGGGLGGGSSDAAAVLRLLNMKFQALRDNELIGLARNLGADVPFCFAGGIALCEGIGDRMEPLPPISGYKVLVVNNGEHVDTAKAYRSIDKRRVEKPQQKEINKNTWLTEIRATGKYDKSFASMKNDFEEVVFDEYPSVFLLKEDLLRFKPEYSVMTGSGSTVIGLFKENDAALEAGCFFENKGFYSRVTEFTQV